MPLIGADMALRQLRGYRMSWIPGAFSRGKTAFAVRMAYEFGLLGYRIISNIGCVFNEIIEPDFLPDMTLKTVIIADEGGRYFRKDSDVLSFMAFAGKMDLVLIVPSIEEPAPILQSLTFQPTFSFRSAGIPLNFYDWKIKMGSFKDSGSFVWAGMEEIYGTYSTKDASTDVSGISVWLQKKVTEYQAWDSARREGINWLHDYEQYAQATANARGGKSNPLSVMDDGGRAFELFRHSIRQVEEQADRLSALSARKSRGR